MYEPLWGTGAHTLVSALCNYMCINDIGKQDKVIAFLDGLSNEALKKEATSEARSETFSSIMKV